MASPLAQAYLQANAAATPQQPFRATVAPTDVTKAYGDYNNAMMQAYSAEVGKQNSMFGGLAGLAGAGVTTLPKLLGASGTAAAGEGSTALADALGLGSGISDADLLASLALV